MRINTYTYEFLESIAINKNQFLNILLKSNEGNLISEFNVQPMLIKVNANKIGR